MIVLILFDFFLLEVSQHFYFTSHFSLAINRQVEFLPLVTNQFLYAFKSLPYEVIHDQILIEACDLKLILERVYRYVERIVPNGRLSALLIHICLVLFLPIFNAYVGIHLAYCLCIPQQLSIHYGEDKFPNSFFI
jgi:hypothetical protein